MSLSAPLGTTTRGNPLMQESLLMWKRPAPTIPPDHAERRSEHDANSHTEDFMRLRTRIALYVSIVLFTMAPAAGPAATQDLFCQWTEMTPKGCMAYILLYREGHGCRVFSRPCTGQSYIPTGDWSMDNCSIRSDAHPGSNFSVDAEGNLVATVRRGTGGTFRPDGGGGWIPVGGEDGSTVMVIPRAMADLPDAAPTGLD